MSSKIRTKRDVQFYREGYGGSSVPALNVKVYNFPVTSDQVAEHFKCSEETAEKALEFAWESAREQFWEGIEEVAQYYLGETLPFGATCSPVKVYSEGRSGGWLIVKGLPDFESWDAIMLSRWRRFAAAVDQDIEWRCDWEQIRDDIEVNEWARDGSERFNFVDTPSGVKSVAELNQKLAQVKREFLTGAAT